MITATGHVGAMRCREIRVSHDQPRTGVPQTDRNAVGGCVGVERKPGCTRLGNGDLGHEQVEAALHPETRNLAGPEATREEATRHRVGASIDFGIGQHAGRRAERRRFGRRRNRASKNFGQQFIAQKIRTIGTLQACRNPGNRV